MTITKADLILHPVRLRVLLALAREQLTTQEIAAQLPDIPKSSIYRHLKLLLEERMVDVAETRLVNGIQEKVYRPIQSTFLGAEDMANLPAEDHIRYFTTFVMTLIQDFAVYVQQPDPVNMLADRTGYQEILFYATTEELDQMGQALRQTFSQLIQNGPGNGRSQHKFVTITHPIKTAE